MRSSPTIQRAGVPRLALEVSLDRPVEESPAPVSSRFAPQSAPRDGSNTARTASQDYNRAARDHPAYHADGSLTARSEHCPGNPASPGEGVEQNALVAARASAVKPRPRGMSAKEYLNTFHGPNRPGARVLP